MLTLIGDILVSELFGFDRLEQGFILQHHTTKHGPNVELLRGMEEMMDAYQEKMDTKRKVGREEMLAKKDAMLDKLDGHHERMMACLGKDGAHRFGRKSRRNGIQNGA
jgi:hypothetical protein